MTRSRWSITTWAACCLALAALVAGCGGKSEDEAPSGGASAGEVKTGPGVTEVLATKTGGPFIADAGDVAALVSVTPSASRTEAAGAAPPAVELIGFVPSPG